MFQHAIKCFQTFLFSFLFGFGFCFLFFWLFWGGKGPKKAILLHFQSFSFYPPKALSSSKYFLLVSLIFLLLLLILIFSCVFFFVSFCIPFQNSIFACFFLFINPFLENTLVCLLFSFLIALSFVLVSPFLFFCCCFDLLVFIIVFMLSVCFFVGGGGVSKVQKSISGPSIGQYQVQACCATHLDQMFTYETGHT